MFSIIQIISSKRKKKHFRNKLFDAIKYTLYPMEFEFFQYFERDS